MPVVENWDFLLEFNEKNSQPFLVILIPPEFSVNSFSWEFPFRLIISKLNDKKLTYAKEDKKKENKPPMHHRKN